MGLYVSAKSFKSWRFQYTFEGKRHGFTLGQWPTVDCRNAYEQTTLAKQMLWNGIDPKYHKLKLRRATKHRLFEDIAKEWHRVYAGDGVWCEGHARNIARLLDKHVYPAIGATSIDKIDADMVVSLINHVRQESTTGVAHRVKQILGQVFKYAVNGRYCRYNPVPREINLPPRKNNHYPAITDLKNSARLMWRIWNGDKPPFNIGSEFAIPMLKLYALLFLRPSELRQLEWNFIDWKNQQIVIPGRLMKKMENHEVHTIPMASQVLTIFTSLYKKNGHRKHVFYNQYDHSKHISHLTAPRTVIKLGFDADTHSIHGFRATAATLLDSECGARLDWIELQLGHRLKDANNNAYKRGTHIKERIIMMQNWADFIDRLVDEYDPE